MQIPNRQFYTMKFKSSRLKRFNYNINITFDEAKELKEIIALADNQMLRSIRDIRNHTIDYKKLEILFKQRDKLKKKKIKNINTDKIVKYKKLINKLSPRSKELPAVKLIEDRIKNPSVSLSNSIEEIQDKINRTMFVPDYITVVMEHSKHYEFIFNNGIIINGKKYKRFSCSAGQARVSTVVLCNEEIIDELKERLNNGRNLNKKIAPSKFNAYFGLAGSATFKVSEPKFVVVKDFYNETTFNSSFVIENDDWKLDDTIIEKEVTLEMNRTDGMGLISPQQSKKWADELGLDWTPAQWCVRQNFIKGMLCTFPIHQFCEEINNGNYIVDTIYKDENGKYIKADLRDYDVIITESQFKLWDSFNNIDEYINNYHKNKLYWGISQYTPKEPKNILKLNYQFIQTLDLNRQDIEDLSSQFVEWVDGVTYKDMAYTLLFLLGINNTEQGIKNYLYSSDMYWVKSLIANPQLKNDKYISKKIYDLIKKRIQNGCLGEIIVDGNFQVLVYDPYGFMQHVCGQKVTGLLKKNEFYSNYWNERGIKLVDGMRSPLTFRAEHVLLGLRNDEEVNKWFRYCNQGIILNYHGHEVVNFGGADVDYDILATTSNPQIIKGVYKDELPVVYDPPKPQKIIFNEKDLYKADTFSFGSIIGSITNKSSNAYALLPNLEGIYGKDSKEYKITFSRLQQCCKAQSAQIDKAKIGREVKGIPERWIKKRDIQTDINGEILDDEETMRNKELYNSILLNKHPYFFKYRYKDAKSKFKKYYDYTDTTCHQKFKMSLDELMQLQKQTPEQKEFIKAYYEYLPLTYSNSPMNLLCRYIETINFNIKQKIKVDGNMEVAQLYKNNNFQYTQDLYENVVNELEHYIKGKRFDKLLPINDNENNIDSIEEFKLDNSCLEERLNKLNGNVYQIVNCLVDYFYISKPSSNKDILWSTYGKYIYNNVKNNTKDKIMFPLPDEKGDIKYLGKTYSMQEVSL